MFPGYNDNDSEKTGELIRASLSMSLIKYFAYGILLLWLSLSGFAWFATFLRIMFNNNNT